MTMTRDERIAHYRFLSNSQQQAYVEASIAEHNHARQQREALEKVALEERLLKEKEIVAYFEYAGVETFSQSILGHRVLYAWWIPNPEENAIAHVVYTVCSRKDRFVRLTGLKILYDRLTWVANSIHSNNLGHDPYHFTLDLHAGPIKTRELKWIREAIRARFYMEAILNRSSLIPVPQKLVNAFRKFYLDL